MTKSIFKKTFEWLFGEFKYGTIVYNSKVVKDYQSHLSDGLRYDKSCPEQQIDQPLHEPTSQARSRSTLPDT